MCRRIALLRNIENVSAKDIVTYLHRLVRIYVLFSALAIYNAVVAESNSSRLLFLIKVVDAILYCVNTGSLTFFVQNPTLCNLYCPLTSASCLWIFYIVSIILQAANSKHDSSSANVNIGVAVFTGLLSLLILGSTIFILLKLRTKMIVCGLEGGIVMAEAEPVQTPLAGAAYAAPAPYNNDYGNNPNNGGVVYGAPTAPPMTGDPYAKKGANNV
jgi:hypothetical protein